MLFHSHVNYIDISINKDDTISSQLTPVLLKTALELLEMDVAYLKLSYGRRTI